MNKVFADTSGWVNFLVPNQPFHDRAVSLMDIWSKSDLHLLTTNYILTEIVALIGSRMRVSRRDMVEFINDLKKSSWIEIVHITPEIDLKAWHLLTERLDKEWSYVDCASFVVMQEHNLQEAYTHDHHLEQAGFTCLLK